MTTTKFEKSIFIFALVWYLITAYFSNGYYHADEHYQIIEFAKLKLGTNIPSDLSWEYHEQIRSTIQPALCFVILKSLHLISITDPYIQALLLRILTCLFAVFTISYFSFSCKKHIHSKNWNTFYFLSFFIWFLPFINVRFSSETYSGLLFLIAISIILRERNSSRHFIIIGILLGLSFIFRFQTIALTFGIIAWLMFVKKTPINKCLFLFIGFSTSVVIGVIIDCWFYNNFVLTAWKYFYSNIVNDVASNFGTSPWYYYFYYIFRYSFFPIGIAILLSFILLLTKQPKSIFIWAVIPFIILHSIIPHKELRFLFPIVLLIPVFLMLAFQEIKNQTEYSSLILKRSVSFLLISLGVINLIGLTVASTKPAGNGAIKITEDIDKNTSCNQICLIEKNGSNPFDPWDGLIAKFYLQHDLTTFDLNSFPASEMLNNECTFLVLKKEDVKDSVVCNFIKQHNLKHVSQSVPAWMDGLLNLYGGYDSKQTLILYKKKI